MVFCSSDGHLLQGSYVINTDDFGEEKNNRPIYSCFILCSRRYTGSRGGEQSISTRERLRLYKNRQNLWQKCYHLNQYANEKRT